MDPRLNRLRHPTATGRPADPKSPSQDARTHFTADSPGTGSGGSTPVHSVKNDRSPTYLSHDDASLMENALVNFGTESGSTVVNRNKRDYLKAASDAAAKELQRAEQTAAKFPVIVEQARQNQNSIDSKLESAEKAVRDSSAAETVAAKDFVRIFFGFLSRDNPKTKSQDDQFDMLKRELQDMRTETNTKFTELNTQLNLLTAENTHCKVQIASLEDKLSQLQGRPCPDVINLATSFEIAQRENKEQISKIKDFQGLPAKVDSLRKDLTLEEKNATKRARDVDSKIEDLQKVISKKGSQLAIKGLEDQIQSQKVMIEAANQAHHELAADLKSLKNFPAAATHGSSEGSSSQKLEQMRQDLIKRMDDSDRTHKAEIEALRAQNNQVHVSTTLAQVESLDVLVATHSRDINLIRDEHTALLSVVDEKIAKSAQSELLAQNTKVLADVQTRLSLLETQSLMDIQEKERTIAELRSMLEDLRQEKTDQIEASHDLITRNIEETEQHAKEIKEKNVMLQSQIDALQKLADQRNESAIVPSNAANLPILSQQIEDLKSQVKTLQTQSKEHNGRHGNIEGQVQPLRNELDRLDRLVTTVIRGQMSSQDREALQSARTLSGRMDKAEHQHQWLRTRFDNLTTEQLYRQIIGYVAPVLPKFEQGLARMELKTETLETMVNEKFTQLTASASDTDKRLQTLDDNLTASKAESQQQYGTLVKQFEEARDSMRQDLKKLHQRAESEARDMKQKTAVESSMRPIGSSTTSVRDSSTTHNSTDRTSIGLGDQSKSQSTPACPGSIQKASNADWINGDSDDEMNLTNEEDSNALLQSFQKPLDPKLSRSSIPSPQKKGKSTPSTPKQIPAQNGADRKRKRDNLSINGDGGRPESGDDNLNPPRKRVQGK